MTVTLIPNPRWVSLTLTFPGVGSITRDKNIHLPIECDDRIAARLIDKFYARLATPEPLTSVTSSIQTETKPTDREATEESSENPALDRMLAAINGAQTVEELQALGLNAAKANAVLEASPVDLAAVSQIIPAKTLSALIAKHE